MRQGEASAEMYSTIEYSRFATDFTPARIFTPCLATNPNPYVHTIHKLDEVAYVTGHLKLSVAYREVVDWDTWRVGTGGFECTSSAHAQGNILTWSQSWLAMKTSNPNGHFMGLGTWSERRWDGCSTAPARP